MSDVEKAMAIWRFTHDNTIHDLMAFSYSELRDPIRRLNGYSGSLCGDYANTVYLLARSAGLQSRIYYLDGHVVSEIKLNGKWTIFDADHEVLYPSSDGRTFAGVDELRSDQRPVIATVDPVYPFPAGSAYMAGIYFRPLDYVTVFPSDGFDMRYSPFYIPQPYTSAGANLPVPYSMSINLRPGERLTRTCTNDGYYVSANDSGLSTQFPSGVQPLLYSNGRLIFEPSLTDDSLNRWAYQRENLVSEGGVRVRPTQGAAAGSLVYRITSPYPIAGGLIDGVFSRTTTDTLKVYVSDDGIHWGSQLKVRHFWQPWNDTNPNLGVPVWESSDTGRWQVSVDLSAALNTKAGDFPAYGYFVKLELAGAGASVEALKIQTIVQIANRSLPLLQNGANQLRYWDQSPSRKVRISYTYEPDAVNLTRVASVSPAADSKDVARDTAVQIRLDRPIDLWNGTGWFFESCAFVYSATEIVPCSVAYDYPSRTVSVQPKRRLAAGTKYTVYVNRRVIWPDAKFGMTPETSWHSAHNPAYSALPQPLTSLSWSFSTAIP